MKVLEKHLFQKNQKMKKWRRPIAYLLTLLAVIGIIALVLLVVIPELGKNSFYDRCPDTTGIRCCCRMG